MSIACILCGHALSSSIEDPREGDRHEALVCGRHSDEDLTSRGLGLLWAGGETRPGSILGDEPVRLSGAWELGPAGAHAIYLLVHNGDLLIITPEPGAVATACVPRHGRLLEAPLGLVEHEVHPWKLAVQEGATISSILRRRDGRVELVFAGRGTVTFSVDLASWRELGDGKHFISEVWTPRR